LFSDECHQSISRVDSLPATSAFNNYTFVARGNGQRGVKRERREEETSAALSIYHPLESRGQHNRDNIMAL